MSAVVESAREGAGNKIRRFGYKTMGWVTRPGPRSPWLLLGAVLVFLMAGCGGGSTANTTPSGGLPAGNTAAEDLAPDFSITLYQGSGELGAEMLNLSDLRGKPVVLNFWAGLCPPCRAEMPDFQAFHEEADGKVTLVGLDVGQFTGLGGKGDAKNLLRDLEITYPAGYTGDESVMRAYRVLTMPTTVFIDSKGAIFRNWSGVLDRETLVDVSNEMLVRAPSS